MLVAGVWLWRRHAASTSAATPTAPAAGDRAGMAGMDMPSGGAVQLTANQLRDFGVTFGTVDQRALESTARTVGTVTVDETRLAQVTPKFGGYVERLYVEATGAPVRRGQPLMDVYSPELVAAEQELLLAATLEQSVGQSTVPGVSSTPVDLVNAARRRLQLWDISDAQIDQILHTGTVRRTLTLYAPASGIVMEKNVVQGQAIQPGQMLYRIANLADVWVDVALREQDAGAVRAGSAASVQLAAYPGRLISGRVAYVYPTLDSSARTVRARVQIPNAAGLLKPGMYATVTLTTPARSALTVPTSALVRTGERTLVFVDMGNGRLMPQEVETGRGGDQYTEVLSGLEPGQRVVTSAQFLLDSESNLAEVMKSMIGQTGTSDMGNMKDMPGMDMSGGAAGGAPSGAMPGMTDKGADMKDMSGMKMPPADSATSTRPRR
jgi:Cu(I)/Ag(I) efflux system membrane fusion protein